MEKRKPAYEDQAAFVYPDRGRFRLKITADMSDRLTNQ
jgi:hypothetical protein